MKIFSKIVAACFVILGVILIAAVTPYPCEVVSIVIGVFFVVGGLCHLLNDER